MKKFISVLFFLFALAAFFPLSSKAIDNPSLYYDWNTYRPDNVVLGLEARAQEEATPSSDASPAPGESPAPPPSPQPPVSTDYKDYIEHNYILGFTSSWTPSDPLYFLKRIEEGVTIAFTFNETAQQELRLEYAGERLHEMETSIAEGNTKVVDNLANSYKNEVNAIANSLEKMDERGVNIAEIANQVDLEVAKHNLVLEEVAIQSPGEVAGAVDEAIIASEHAVDTVADVEGKPAVPEGVVERLQASKALGILTEEEVQNVISSETRQEAREELRGYVEENLFPESDFKRFDETALQYYPNGYYTVLELKKFEELKDLETQRPDDATLAKVQEFAKVYKPGEAVPGEIRRWWVPMVRLEELQNTIRPDLISGDYFRNRPDYFQKYQEVVERVKPRQEDIDYVNGLINKNPNLLNDPSYARIKAIADKFGAGTGERPAYYTSEGTESRAADCGGGSHWVFIPYMPQGGYCAPNYDFPRDREGGGGADVPCPSGYHRNYFGGACYPDSSTGGGIYLPAVGSCYAGYHWVVIGGSGARGGYCTPDTVTDGGGFPSPIYTIGYCLPGQMFRDGKCETYNSAPKEGCSSGSWWNGTSCIQVKTCAAGEYQDNSGECKKSSEYPRTCIAPAAGCGFNAYWDYAGCTCKPTLQPWGGSGSGTGSPSASEQEATCRAGGGVCVSWVNGACGCERSSSGTGTSGGGSSPYPYYYSGGYTPMPYQTPYNGGSSGSTSCGSGYYWNGSYCAPSTGGGTYYSYPTPSGTGYSYPTPYSGTGSYPTPSYSYPSPSYVTPTGTQSYPTPSYGTPTYGTPEYPTPSYGTPEYTTPYGTP